MNMKPYLTRGISLRFWVCVKNNQLGDRKNSTNKGVSGPDKGVFAELNLE
ncbi:MAG: hypothetical protein KAV83_06445 [Desulfobacterales bacterium]|nr:hypothetical protein [Desulfobacterales bacterium]